ncbi:MAG: hypothetical protein M0Z84_05075 [Gammaproteobacteria bacterium]|nr:hypothetical protein [Gammaproteobacteria bacterium]
MSELAFAALQAPFGLAQAVGASRLAERHRRKPASGALPHGRVLGTGFLRRVLEIGARDDLEYLAEHAA